MKAKQSSRFLKQFLLIFSFIFVLQIIYMPDHVQAASSTTADYTYVTTSDGKITIKKYLGNGNSPSIPAAINKKPVTKIDSGAFQYKPIVSVTLPDSIKVIGDNAFKGTKYLNYICQKELHP